MLEGSGLLQGARSYQAIAAARRESSKLIAAAQAADSGAIRFRACGLSDTRALSALVESRHDESGRRYGVVKNTGQATSGILDTMNDAASRSWFG
jgi:hypothetical protein